MIFPSIYNYNAPYRGPKDAKETEKLFSSIVHDIIVIYDRLEERRKELSANLRFYAHADIEPSVKTDMAAIYDGVLYSFKGTSDLVCDMNNLSATADHIFEYLGGI